MARDLSTVVLESLAAVGVTHIFGIPGDAINGLLDAVRRQDTIEFVGVRHEETGALAAAAQAKLTGKLGVVVGTAGPGAVHLLNGLYDAKLDRAPVLAITGQVETSQIGLHTHQEIDIHSLFADVAVFSETVVDPEQMPDLVRTAIRTAVASKGVAHITLPSNLALAKVAGNDESPILPPDSVSRPCDADLNQAARTLNQSTATTLLVGYGARDAIPEVLELAEILKAPIILTLRGKHLIHDSHPLLLGGIGLLGTEPAVDALDETDVLFMIGTDFPYEDFLPHDAKAIQLDLNQGTIGRRTSVEVGLTGDAREALRALKPLLQTPADNNHLSRSRERMEVWRDQMKSIETDESTPIRPQAVAAAISRQTTPGTVYVCDTGAVTVWAARHLAMKADDRFTLSGGLATMAYGMAGAVGAQIALPDKTVVALVGDGGFSMLLGDLLTVATLNLPIKIVVFNNSKLGLIQMEQEAEGLPEFETELDNPDFSTVARSMGVAGWRVTDPGHLDETLGAAFDHDGPAVIDVVVNPDELTIPPKLEARFVFGYAAAKVKEVLGLGSSRGGLEPLKELASTARERITGGIDD